MGGAAGAASRLEATTDGGGRAFEPGMSPSESGGGRGAPETRGPAADRTRWMAHDGRRREAGVKSPVIKVCSLLPAATVTALPEGLFTLPDYGNLASRTEPSAHRSRDKMQANWCHTGAFCSVQLCSSFNEQPVILNQCLHVSHWVVRRRGCKSVLR